MKKKLLSKDFAYITFISAATAVLILFMCFFLDKLGNDNIYNSYMLQAKAWLHGHLSLEHDYPHLELAIFKNKYFVSFPPFPSYLMLPFAAIGFEKGDAVISLISAVLAVVYSFKIMRHFGHSECRSVFWALFVTIGSNWLFCAVSPWVWFIAQNLAFTLSAMAIYYALSKKAGLSLTFWACAVGCRPLQAVYIIVLLYIIYKNFSDDGITFKDMLCKKWKCLIAPFIIAVSYMTLNYMRFGNILEFGHNYLPEFTRTSTGQFNISYLVKNFPQFFRFPFEKGSNKFIAFDGFCMFVASPIFISYSVYTVISLLNKKKRGVMLALFATILLHMVFIAMHKTMGGSHYGNRYTNDILPFVLAAIGYSLPESKKAEWINIFPFMLGLSLNILWLFMFYA